MNPDDLDWAVRRISSHLVANPLACDTCEGIARWWMGTGREVPLRPTQAAIDRMASLGLLERLPAADGRVRYRLAALDDAARALLHRLARGGH